MNTLTTFSATQAAEEAGVAVPTITRAIKAGRLSAQKLEDGTFEIQAAELFRVYPPKQKNEEAPSVRELLARIEGLERETQLLQKVADTAEKQTESAQRERDKWQAQAERITLLLPNPEQKPVKKGVLSRIFGS